MKPSKKPDIDLIVRYIHNEVTEKESAWIQSQLAENAEWADALKRQTALINQLQQMPCYDPPSRVWATIRSEIQQTHRKPAWQLWLQDLFSPAKFAAVSILATLIVSMWYIQVNYEQDFQIVDVSEDNSFSVEAGVYFANHEIIQDNPITEEALLAFYPEKSNSMTDEEC